MLSSRFAPSRLNRARTSALREAHARGCQPVLSCFRAFARPSFASPEGGGAPARRRTWGTFLRRHPACRLWRQTAPSGAPPRRFWARSPYFFHRTRRLRRPVIQSAFALPFVRRCPSHSRRSPHRERTVTAPPGTRLRTSPAGAAIPAPPTERLRGTPSVNGDGEEYSPTRSVRQVHRWMNLDQPTDFSNQKQQPSRRR